MRRPRSLVLLAALAAVAGGCGRGGEERFSLRTPPEHRVPALPSTPSTGRGARQPRPTQRDAERLRPLIAGWANALRKGDVERAALYFALPAIVAQSAAIKLATRDDVRAFNAALECGDRLLRVGHEGRFIVGTFRLTARPGQTCPTAGERVRVAFVIRSRHFTEWRQVPDTPGAAPGPPQPEDLESLPRPSSPDTA